MRHCELTAAALALWGLPVAAYPQPPASDRVVVDVEDCVRLDTRDEQLACYAERVNEVVRAREGNDTSTAAERPAVDAATPEPPSSRASSRAERREAIEVERRRQDAAAKAAAAEEAAQLAAQAAAAVDDPSHIAGEIVASIIALRQVEPDTYLITLDNDQIWRQNQPKRYTLRVGAEVRLRPTEWGPSYRLTDPRVGGFISVKRLR